MTDLTALIVAGGRSTRFGETDKALATVGTGPMIRHVADALAPLTDELVVNCRREQVEGFTEALPNHDPRFATDLVPDEGPVAGLLTGLRAVRTPRVVVAPCDQPLLRPHDIKRLVRADARQAVISEADGWPQPFPGVYPTEATREACERTLACGSRRLLEVIGRLSHVAIPADPAACASIDTRPECRSADERLNAQVFADGGY